MRVDFKCGDPAALAGYLYDECEAGERAAIDAHLATCAACAAELAALGATRRALASWAPPEASLGFRITSDPEPATVLRPARWWQQPLPAWAQVAAAAIVFASGALLGMQRAGQTPVATPASVAPASANVSTVSTRDLVALEKRLRDEMGAMRASSGARTDHVSSSDDAVVQRVKALLAESEQRQQRELALRMTQVVRDVDSQRTMDLSRIERTFGQMEGVTRPELAEQRQMINYLIQRTGLQQRAPQ